MVVKFQSDDDLVIKKDLFKLIREETLGIYTLILISFIVVFLYLVYIILLQFHIWRSRIPLLKRINWMLSESLESAKSADQLLSRVKSEEIAHKEYYSRTALMRFFQLLKGKWTIAIHLTGMAAVILLCFSLSYPIDKYLAQFPFYGKKF